MEERSNSRRSIPWPIWKKDPTTGSSGSWSTGKKYQTDSSTLRYIEERPALHRWVRPWLSLKRDEDFASKKFDFVFELFSKKIVPSWL
jgi:hypothetical protein